MQPHIALSIMKHDFHQRRENRIEHAENMASKKEAESTELYLRSTEMASVIPMGQPILIGHHSERRDRNYREKIHNTMGRSVEASNKAGYYADRAESIKNNEAIFSDDPEALQKLEAKLKSMSDLADFMKAANVCIRKKDRDGFLRLPMASEKTWEELHSEKRFGGFGFAGFTLSNNSAERRRLKQRIEKLKKLQETAVLDLMINSVRIFENREANRLQIIFEDKPAAEIIKQLKSSGFRWCRSEGAWQRHISNSAIYCAKLIVNSLDPK